ncbi:T9SS type A sorting domain-containing protein [Aquimarina sp. U1-2]|uniref:GEVED domain-containing protein n=1 Tax=Aquimarina sp. U1-2 TaxID=2823141 RepID=UPI001AECDFEC|nr:GEVED domain-containing protein [Aquimarina sp. U1-2]MBP2831327.1 T9SS type A sorting domain-containing protein [Aquimarina sp. U1-2]
MLWKKIWVIAMFFVITLGYAQDKKMARPTLVTTAVDVKEVLPLHSRKLIAAKPRSGKVNPKSWSASKVVPGKGLPKGQDPLISKQKSTYRAKKSKAPSLVFQSASTRLDPSDPTGAVGPNHYVSALNSEFAIHDKRGNLLLGPSSLANIWEDERLGDPIVFYDNFADRFVITQFDGTPNSSTDPDNGFLIAVSQGPDPVNDGWYTFRFRTGNTFPDYPKFSVWSDGYYITTNKDQGTQTESEVIYVIERDKILSGDQNARMIGFPLPGSSINGFYSPASFNAIGTTPPPLGNAKIIYMQDDAWAGVDQDILKLWTISMNWLNPNQSTIQEAEELSVTPFDGVFDGAFFNNLPQPDGGISLDAQQAVIMHATNYRRFCNYNSVVLNFAVDIDDRQDSDNVAGIRWYELRQTGDNQPWTIYQEGTYTSTDGKSAWCGSMAMDIHGNIGMAYTTMGTTSNGATQDSYASIRYTGRLADDPLGVMTFAEETIVEGTGINDSNRYGDYAHMTVDPIDDKTFWHTAEYFENENTDAKNIVGVFTIAEDTTSDVGVVRIDSPANAVLTNSETITIAIKNFGTSVQTDIPVSYTVEGNSPVTEIVPGPVNAGETIVFSFSTVTDLTSERSYIITAETNLSGDTMPENDCTSREIKNLLANDVGVTNLISLASGVQFSSAEEITITLFNYGGVSQTNIPVFYSINGETTVNEVFTGTLASQQSATYTFTTAANLQDLGTYTIALGTLLTTDEDTTNDSIERNFENLLCRPTSNCARFGDGITYFQLANVTNFPINCNTGYEDFTDHTPIQLTRATPYTLTVRSGFADDNESERFSFWIDVNDNNIFENTELILNNQVITEINTDQTYTFTLDDNTALGSHLCRIRGGDVNSNEEGALLNDTCGSMLFGTTHDYTVEVLDRPIGPDPNVATRLIVVSQPNNQFIITKTDPDGPVEERIYIFNLLGQIVASNLVKKDGNNTFTYELDMSFARSGIYFARLGNSKNNVAGFGVL